MEIKNILISVIPHSEQRYNTVGDWLFHPDHPDTLLVYVSETGNWKWNMCIALHELIEAVLCTADRVTQEEVDEFDKNWKPNAAWEEPGEDPRAPYFIQHGTASNIERHFFGCITADELWDEYEVKLEELMKSRE